MNSQTFQLHTPGIITNITIDELSITISTPNCLTWPGISVCDDPPSNLAEKYLQLHPLFGGYVVRCNDLIQRVDSRSVKELLLQDIKNKDRPVVTCEFWDVYKGKIQAKTVQQSRLGDVLRRLRHLYTNPKAFIAAYRAEWILCLNLAIAFANQRLTRNRNPFNRFHKLRRPISLYIAPGPSLAGFNEQALLSFIKKAEEHDQNASVSLISADSPQYNGYKYLSTNPLGLYTTWIKPQDLDQLISDQTRTPKGRWAQKPPDNRKLRLFNQYMLDKGRHGLKHNTLEPTSHWSLLQWPGQTVQYYKRRSTESVMGGSANKWATRDLGWHADGTHRTEWLHMIAHRFEPNTGDRFGNLLFGTKECNTDMMRAEAAVDQLLYSGKVSAVGIQVQAPHNLHSVDINDRSRIFDGKQESTIVSNWSPFNAQYPKWLSLEVIYKIQYYRRNHRGKLFVHTSTTRFHPFSARCPLFFEYMLDQILLEEVLTYYEPIELGFESFFGEISKHTDWRTRRLQMLLSMDSLGRGRDGLFLPENETATNATDAKLNKEFRDKYKNNPEDDLETELEDLILDQLHLSDADDSDQSPLICDEDHYQGPQRIYKQKVKSTRTNREKRRVLSKVEALKMQSWSAITTRSKTTAESKRSWQDQSHSEMEEEQGI